MMLSIFHVCICNQYIFFGKASTGIFWPFFNWSIYFLFVEFWEFFIYFWSISLCQVCDFASIYPLSVAFLFILKVSFTEQKINFDEVQFIIFSFMEHDFGIYLRTLCLAQTHKDFLCFLLKVLQFDILHLGQQSIMS